MKINREITGWTNPAAFETIDHAWWTVRRNSVNAPCRDVVDFADFKSHEEYVRTAVLKQLKISTPE